MPIKNAGPMSFDLTFEGYGIVNGIRYKDNGTGIFLTNPVDGSVYQKGVIDLKTDSDAIETTYESISRKHDNGIVLDNGIMIFNTPSSKGVELSFLNDTVAAYKDMIDLKKRQSNYYSMGIEIELYSNQYSNNPNKLNLILTVGLVYLSFFVAGILML